MLTGAGYAGMYGYAAVAAGQGNPDAALLLKKRVEGIEPPLKHLLGQLLADAAANDRAEDGAVEAFCQFEKDLNRIGLKKPSKEGNTFGGFDFCNLDPFQCGGAQYGQPHEDDDDSENDNVAEFETDPDTGEKYSRFDDGPGAKAFRARAARERVPLPTPEAKANLYRSVKFWIWVATTTESDAADIRALNEELDHMLKQMDFVQGTISSGAAKLSTGSQCITEFYTVLLKISRRGADMKAKHDRIRAMNESYYEYFCP
ncbi:hypothetical protein M885DRAFT_511195 [Pelagophyceae sp. CCMP2097]|nr:hypothetical protein M885DRAFT_511195 [Pelagophyceae sp. CCMP2097]